MPQLSRQDNILQSKIACQWISLLHNGRNQEAARMLAPDCVLLGVQTKRHSHVFIPILSLTWLPRVKVRRVFAVDGTVSFHVALADFDSTAQVYRIYFRFCFSKITKVDLSELVDDCHLPFEQSQFELPLGEVIFF